MRHVLGEALQRRPRVLNWGPSSDYHSASVLRESKNKQSLNRVDTLLRYDPRSVGIPVESLPAGLVLLRLRGQGGYPEYTGRLRTGPTSEISDSEMGQSAGSGRWVRPTPGTACGSRVEGTAEL